MAQGGSAVRGGVVVRDLVGDHKDVALPGEHVAYHVIELADLVDDSMERNVEIDESTGPQEVECLAGIDGGGQDMSWSFRVVRMDNASVALRNALVTIRA